MINLFPWKLKISKDYQKLYIASRDASNAERLRFAAYIVALMFICLLIRHLIYPETERASFAYIAYFILFVLFISSSVLYILFDRFVSRKSGSTIAQWVFVFLVLTGTSSLAVFDNAATGDLTAFLFGLIGVAVFFRCSTIWFPVFAGVAITILLLGTYLLSGKLLLTSFFVQIILDVLSIVIISIVFNYYDIRSYCLQKDLEASLFEKDMILKEVHHRIKNNMGTICGLLSLQSISVKEPEAKSAIEDAENRVHSMMLLYDKLYQSVSYIELSIKDYLSSTIDEIVSNFPNSNKVKIEKKIDDFFLDTKRLQNLGIIINELITNMMKYAFTANIEGIIKIEIELHSSQGKNNQNVNIIIQDDGIGLPESVDFDNTNGFGLLLVKSLTGQLKGTIKIERVKGTKFILEFMI